MTTTIARSARVRRVQAPITISYGAPQPYYVPLQRYAWLSTKVLDPIHGVQSITQRVKLA